MHASESWTGWAAWRRRLVTVALGIVLSIQPGCM